MPASPPHSLALIVVTHNSHAWLPGFVASWTQTRNAAVAAGLLASDHATCLAVDSGSTDGSAALLQQLCPSVNLERCQNIGYGAALNRAAATSNATWLLLCNADLTFPPDFLPGLLRCLDQHGAPNPEPPACIASRLLNPDGSCQPSVGHFPTITSLLRDQFRPRPLRKYQRPQPTRASRVDWASAACLLVRRDAFASIGGFDEHYFLYMEEVDLQRRLHSAGQATRFVPEITVTHHNPNALRPPCAEIQRYAARGLLRYFAKHGRHRLLIYRALAFLSGRLTVKEALASRKSILARATGP